MDDKNQSIRDELMLFGYCMSGSLSYAAILADEVTGILRSEPPSRADDTGIKPYEIAAGICIPRLRESKPRGLPLWTGTPSRSPVDGPLDCKDNLWLQPFPDSLFTGKGCRSANFKARESISLEFTGALQLLKPADRALFLLGEILGFDYSTAAGVTEKTAGAKTAALQDIQSEFEGRYLRDRGRREPPGDEDAGMLLMRYIHNWEAAEPDGLEAMFSRDVTLQSTASGDCVKGKAGVIENISSGYLRGDAKGRWRLLPRRANGQLALGVYERDYRHNCYCACSLHIIYFEGNIISEIIVFNCASLFPLFGLLTELEVQGRVL